jgi:stalled ribosome rescue protein Dom34
MTTAKNLGICMDHSSAHLMELTIASPEADIILSEFTPDVKASILQKGEKAMHNKEQQLQASYYQELGEEIKNYESVVLFGPTRAKEELFNILKEDLSFSQIHIEVRQTDKMTENQQQAFVRNYFARK